MDSESSSHTERVFAQLGKALSSTTSAVSAADIILSAADDLIGWEACYLILYDPEQGGRPRPLLAMDTIRNERVRMADVAPEVPSPNMLRAISEDGFLSLYDQERVIDPLLIFGNTDRRTLSQLYVPVRTGKRTIGILSIQHYARKAYTERSLDTLRSLANHCAGALERVWAQEALTHMVERLTALYKAAQAVSASLDIDQLYDAIHTTVEKVMPCDDFVIDGYDAESNEIVPLYAIEHPRLRVWAERYYADHGMAGKIVHTGTSILLNSLEEIGSSGINFELYGSSTPDPTQSILAVPMVLHGKVSGMISTQSYQSNAYTKDDQSLLELLATHAAIAIENARLFATIQQLADTDPLTGLLTRRKFYELAEREFTRSKRYHEPLIVILLDIDNFKRFNDQYGHKVGDAILQLIASQLKGNIREVDILCRHGGEEFVIVLPNTEPRTAMGMAERLRQLIEQSDLKAAMEFLESAGTSRPTMAAIHVTVSVGLAEFSPSCPTLDVLIDRADRAMYEAKNAGRNRVKFWREP